MPSDLTTDDLQRLRSVAESATKGPWLDECPYVAGMVKGGRPNGEVIFMADPNRLSIVRNESPANCAYLAAFDPPTALALLDRIAALEAELAESRAQTQAILTAMDPQASQLLKNVAALERERDRYRKALEDILARRIVCTHGREYAAIVRKAIGTETP